MLLAASLVMLKYENLCNNAGRSKSTVTQNLEMLKSLEILEEGLEFKEGGLLRKCSFSSNFALVQLLFTKGERKYVLCQFLHLSIFFQEAPEARDPVLGEGDPPGEGEHLEPGDRDGGGKPWHPWCQIQTGGLAYCRGSGKLKQYFVTKEKKIVDRTNLHNFV